jgi:hypothetical protein
MMSTLTSTMMSTVEPPCAMVGMASPDGEVVGDEWMPARR